MGSRARREKEKDEMRQAILKAATKIMVEEGYEKLTMRKIAGIIDYTPTTIYNYYNDKAQIVDDISRQIYKKIVSDVKESFEENMANPIDKQLAAAFKAFLNSITDNVEMGRAVIKSGTKAIFGPEKEAVAQEDNGILLLHNLLLKGQQQSVLRKLDENMSWMLITALIGFSINAIENQLYLNKNWPDMVNTYTELLVNGLLPNKD